MPETTQPTDTPASPRTHGWCHWHKGLGEHPALIQVVEAGSGSGASLYACTRCKVRHHLVPIGEQR